MIFLCNVRVFAEEIYLKNHDKITGTIAGENEEIISVRTKAMGIVSLKREFIKQIVASKEDVVKQKEKETPEIIWQREVSVGYDTSRGNTGTEQLSASGLINRNHKHVNEWTVKGNLYYSSVDKKMDAQRWYGMARYAFSFEKSKKWYNFYRFENDHDRFANIHYRMVPATGIGYWFFDLPDTKLMTEMAIGFEYSDFSDETKDAVSVVLIPRAHYEQELFERAVISQNLFYYPSIENFNSYRIHSETLLTMFLSEMLAVRLSLIDDYDSEPADDTKKNDIRFESSLVYKY